MPAPDERRPAEPPAERPADRPGDRLGDRLDAHLVAFWDRRASDLEPLGPAARPLLDAARTAVEGGKRLRARFCHAGWCAAGGAPDDERIVAAASAFEWLQASALVHDDLMDGSDTRRGRPSAHRVFERSHRDAGWSGDPERFGAGGAVLLGDLMLVWADDALRGSGLPTDVLAAAAEPWERCRSEVAAGQFLDLVQQARAVHDVDEAMRVVRFKAATYTVERPLQVGAALAGGGADLLAALSRVGLPLGEAFQLRDDLLGVFGDPAVTGKPAGDDLREGKHTVLVALAHAGADDAGRADLDRLVGDPALDAGGVERLREVIEGSGARAAVEERITGLEADVRVALDEAPVDDGARAHLAALAGRATRRQA